MLSGSDGHPPPPQAGAAEVAPGVQIALQTSPQRPRTQPPPGGPSGKLERDSVCRPPWGGSGGGEGLTITHAPLPSASCTNAGGGGLRPPQNQGLRTALAALGKAEVKRLARRSPFSLPNPKTQLSDHPGSRGQSRARLLTLQTAVTGDQRRGHQICWCLLAAHGTSPTPRTPSDS